MQSIQDMDAYVSKIEVIDSKKVKAGHIQFTLKITGRTRFMLLSPHAKEPIQYNLKLRYRQLRSFHKAITPELSPYIHTNHIVIPEFPPKKYINSSSKNFLEKRKADLNEYFGGLFGVCESMSHSAQVISFCAPIKNDIILCGSLNKYMGYLCEQLAITVRSLSNIKKLYKSLPSQDCYSFINEEMEGNAIKPNLIAQMFKPKDDSSENMKQWPMDFIYDNMVYRIDAEEHDLGKVRSKGAMINVITKWVENDSSIIVTVNLNIQQSVELGKEIVEALKTVISKKLKPVFVIVGLYSSSVRRVVSLEEMSDTIIKQSSCYPMKYIELDVDNPTNTADILHYLLWAKQMRDFE